MKEKSLTTLPRGKKRATSQTANIGGKQRNPTIRSFPSAKSQRPFRSVDDQVGVRATYCPYYVKLSLKADEPSILQLW